jgi:hypothetical protein
MLDHIHVLDRRIDTLSQVLEQRGISGHFDQLPDLEVSEIDSVTDEARKGAASAEAARVDADGSSGVA